jgi:hypothetical protein
MQLVILHNYLSFFWQLVMLNYSTFATVTDSSITIATGYGLDDQGGQEFESR